HATHKEKRESWYQRRSSLLTCFEQLDAGKWQFVFEVLSNAFSEIYCRYLFGYRDPSAYDFAPVFHLALLFAMSGKVAVEFADANRLHRSKYDRHVSFRQADTKRRAAAAKAKLPVPTRIEIPNPSGPGAQMARNELHFRKHFGQ